jgi:orotidine-5'-phosphate decarboxylase
MSDLFISTKSIPVRERLIMALDVSSISEAQALVEELGDAVIFYKVGMELFMSGDYFAFIEWLKARNKKSICRSKVF